MATVKEQTKAEVLRENRGDLALTHSVADDVIIDPRTIQNATNFKRNVWPGLVVYKKDPSKNFAHFWWREGTDEFSEDELENLKEKGYFFVTEADFTVKKWNRTADGRIRSGKFLLLAIPQEEHEAITNKKLRQLGAQLDEKAAGFHNIADRAGFGSWEMRGGKSREVAKGRSEVDLG